MLSQFFSRVSLQPQRLRHLQRVGMYSSLGLLAMVVALSGRPAVAQTSDLPHTPTTKTAFLQEFPHNIAATKLGNTVATNRDIYCGTAGTPTEVTIAETERLICSTGGDIPDNTAPISTTVAEQFWNNTPLQEPMVLQQSDRAQLFPR